MSVIVCAVSLQEYTPGTGDCEWPIYIDPARPHQHGEYQDCHSVDDPCDCTPVKISNAEYDRRKTAVWERLELS